jgi:ubiquitin carboxyl-terminal hydrolase 7
MEPFSDHVQDAFDLLVPKNGNVGDIVTELIKKARIDDEAKSGPIAVYETHSHKIYKELSREYAVVSINDYVQLFAERIPAEDVGGDVEMINAFHYDKEPSKSHGIPFSFRLIKDEKFVDTKKRLEKRTGMKGKNFEKIKFSLVKRSAYSKPTYIQDDDILFNLTDDREDLLGLDHPDRSRVVRNGAGDLFLR